MKEATLLGKMLYRVYHLPKRVVRNLAQKGIAASYLDFVGEQRMKQFARQCSYESPGEYSAPSLNFLTGKKYWYQTILCAYSFLKVSHRNVPIHIWDDGTLQNDHRECFRNFYQGIVLHSLEEIRTQLDENLPVEKFPFLRKRRIGYPHLRKLTDVHAGATGWRAVLDSDMLFFKRPEALLNWMDHPLQSCCLSDSVTSYGYDFTYLQSFIKEPLFEKVNVGLLGLQSDRIDWDLLEHWCKSMIEDCGTHYTQEQALSALIVSKEKSVNILPADEYVVLPTREEVQKPTAALHHYVADSKSWYFRYGWQHIG